MLSNLDDFTRRNGSWREDYENLASACTMTFLVESTTKKLITFGRWGEVKYSVLPEFEDFALIRINDIEIQVQKNSVH